MKIFLVIVLIVIIIAGAYYFVFGRQVISVESKLVQSCADNDGKDIFVRNTTSYTDQTGNQFTSTDRCDFFSSKAASRVGLVEENYCKDDKVVTEKRKCPRNRVCRDGACVPGTKELTICSDSDNGKNNKVFGATVGLGGSGEDSCWTSLNQDPEIGGAFGPECKNEGQIKCYTYEYYCDGDNIKHEVMPCENGCRGGVCL